MRDGVRLATNLYRPGLNGSPVQGRFPVILERTPYDKDHSESWAAYFVPRGYPERPEAQPNQNANAGD